MTTSITFQVNLQTVGYPTGWEQPNRTTTSGNETVSEAANMAATRGLWLPSLLGANHAGVGPSQSDPNLSGYLKHGSQFTVTGYRALYLKKTYVSTPAAPTDVLQIVSQNIT